MKKLGTIEPVSLEGNPSVNRKLIKMADEFAAQLERLGLEPRPHYNLAPALGGTIVSKPAVETTVAQGSPVGQTTDAGNQS